MRSLAAIFGSVVLSAAAQLILRYGMTQERSRRLRCLILWFICFSLAFLLWIAALSKVEISLAYPLLGIGYVLVTVLAHWILHEPVSRIRWIAVLLITVGVAIVGGSR